MIPSFVSASAVVCDHWLTGASPWWSGTVTLVSVLKTLCVSISGSPYVNPCNPRVKAWLKSEVLSAIAPGAAPSAAAEASAVAAIACLIVLAMRDLMVLLPRFEWDGGAPRWSLRRNRRAQSQGPVVAGDVVAVLIGSTVCEFLWTLRGNRRDLSGAIAFHQFRRGDTRW